MNNIIEVRDLKKHFVTYQKKSGFKGMISSMFKPEKTVKKAVDGINFDIAKGEIIGFIGPNGAGKSTTIKMLTGILVPTDGELKVNGMIPHENRKENAKNIGVVFGQRTQLWWNLNVYESFDLLKTIYRVPNDQYKKTIELFSDLLDVDEYMNTPVRQLSLGQRMRVEIAASLLHSPQLVYLDEPTIGLDIIAKEKISEFITEVNKETGVTIILTTHDMRDIEKLCNRIIVIDKGNIIYNGSMKAVKEQYAKDRFLVIDFDEYVPQLQISHGRVFKEEGTAKHIIFNRDEVSAIEIVQNISTQHKIRDFSLMETDIDNVIKRIYENPAV